MPRSQPPSRTARVARLARWAPPLALACVATLLATPASAVIRTCGSDPVANTADVLCAPPSGPCTATTVTVSTGIAIPDQARCRFDLGGRSLTVERTLEVTGRGFQLNGTIEIFNAGDVTITETGKLKARGDFVQPHGFIVNGGFLSLESDGLIMIAGLLDVSGDSAGEILIEASGDVALAPTGHVRGNGISSFLDEGERFADGAFVAILSNAGTMRLEGTVTLSGQSLGAGGTLELGAARDILIATKLTATGNDGGLIEATAGDHISITRSIDVDGTGDGFGGEIELDAGGDFDTDHDLVPGGSVLVDGVTFTMRGGALDGFGGDAGNLTIFALGNITMTDVVVRADADPAFDGSGGTIDLDNQYGRGTPVGPLDGDIALDGFLSLRGGNGDPSGFGGTLFVNAGRDVIQRAVIDAASADGGDIDLQAKGAISLSGAIDAALPNGDGGDIFAFAGLGSQGGVTVGTNLIAGGASRNTGYIYLAGCTLTVEPGLKLDARTDRDSFMTLTSVAPMQLGAGSRYLGAAGSPIRLIYPPGATPLIGDGVVFDPGRTDLVTTVGLPGCPPPGCGNGILESGEECDDGNVRDHDSCSAQCEIQCERAPRGGCPRPAVGLRAALEIRDDGDDARDRLIWRWLKGAATTRHTFGDPEATHHYALCLYDADGVSSALRFEAVAPAGDLCRGRPCWTETNRGPVYDDPDGTPTGVSTLRLEPGAAGDAKIITLAKGANALLPALPLALPARVQLQGSHGACWEAIYSAAERNDGTRFEAVGD